MGFRIDGLDDELNRLRRLQANTKALEGSHEVPASEVFTPSFMRQYTRVPTFDALIETGGFKVSSTEDFAAIREEDWERVIRQHTDFGSWQEMQVKGAEEYAKRKLMSGL